MYTLTEDQTNALEKLVDFLSANSSNQIFILEGGSGVGKTSTIKELLAQWKNLTIVNPHVFPNYNFVFSATTNKAADHLQHQLKHPVRTVHSTLGINPKYQTRASKQYCENDVVIIDEASFLTKDLCDVFMDATIARGAKAILIGDAYQLRCPQGIPLDLNDLMSKFSSASLNQVVRQDSTNPIQQLNTDLRNLVKSQVMPQCQPDNKHILVLDKDEFLEQYLTDVANNPIGDVRALAWTNAKVQEYNNLALQHCTDRSEIQVGDTLVLNSAMIVNRNMLTTDSMHVVTQMDEHWSTDSVLGYQYKTVTLDNYHKVRITPDYLETKNNLEQHEKMTESMFTNIFSTTIADLRFLYASTVHKAQGSTYPIVYIDLDDLGKCTEKDTLYRLLYVGATRASQKLVFTGDI